MVAELPGDNLFAGLASGARDERFDLLAQSPGTRIERIVSTGQASPPGFWYDQPEDEFVVLLSGAARLRLEAEGGTFLLELRDCATTRALLDALPVPFGEAAAKGLAVQALRGLAHLHAHFVLHRDLKMSNLLLTAAGVVLPTVNSTDSFQVRMRVQRDF